MKKKILFLLLTFVFILPSIVLADDTRIVITNVQMTSDMEVPVYGGRVQKSYETVATVGSPAYMADSMGEWFKFDGESWNRYEAGLFNEGRYRYSNQIRIDGPEGSNYRLSNETTLTVNGVGWTPGADVVIDNTYSYKYFRSPEYVVEKTELELTFEKTSSYNIPVNYVNYAIKSFSVVESVLGGVGSYTFSKMSGPEWINVSSDGTISGTPTVIGENSVLVVRVTDEEENYKEISLNVDNTYADPADRTNVLAVEITSNMETPTYGGEVKSSYTYNTTVGSPAYMTPHMGSWYKYNGSSWVRYNEATFTEGTYRFNNQIRVDEAAGYTHKLTEETTLLVDGESWTPNADLVVANTYTYRYFRSPEYVVKMPVTVVFNTNGGSNIPNQNIFKGDKAERPENPTRDDDIFVGWFEDPELTIPFDFDKIINENTIIYAKWTVVLHELYATITVPVNGDHPDFTPVSANPEAYRVEFMKWSYTFPTYTELTEEDVFVAGKTYDFGVRFVANEGYEIDGGADYYINNELSVTAYHLGSERGMSFIAETAEITSFNITGIVAPKGGKLPNTEDIGITTPGVVLRETRWIDEASEHIMEGTDKFSAKRKYILVLEFDPAVGYIFAEEIGEDNINANAQYLMGEFIKERPEIRLYYEAIEPQLITSAPKVKVTNANENTLLVSYNDPDNTEEFEIYRSTNKKKNFKKIATVTTTSYVDTGLTYGTTYYYKVKAINTLNNKTSSVVSGKTIPNKVENLRVDSIGSTNVKLSYDKVNVNGYEVYYGTSAKKMSKATTISNSNTLTYNKTKLKSNTTYYFKVKAYKKVGRKKIYGSFSDTVKVRTAPAVPKVTVSNKDYESLSISVKASSGAVSYEIQKSLDKTSYDTIKVLDKAGNYVDTGLTLGTTYYYRVKACNSESKCSGWTSVLSKKVILTTPSTPKKTLGIFNIKLDINKVNGAEGYEIYRSTSKKKNYKLVTTLDSETLTYNDTGLSENKTYYYKVRAYRTVDDTKVYSSYSSILTARTKKMSSSQRKALSKAKSYVKSTYGYSYNTLYAALKKLKYSDSVIKFAIQYSKVNYKTEAVEVAKRLASKQEYYAFEMLIALHDLGFSDEDAEYGALNAGISYLPEE